LACSSTLKMEAICSSEISCSLWTTWRYIFPVTTMRTSNSINSLNYSMFQCKKKKSLTDTTKVVDLLAYKQRKLSTHSFLITTVKS
jgi:hypothetical protein